VLAAAAAPDRRVGPYVVKLAATGSDVLAATFLTVPGSRPAHPNPEVCRRPVAAPDSSGYAITVAGDGALLVAGQAAPADFPATAGAVNSSDVAFRDAFVARIDASGTAIGFVARFGGLDNDRATSIALAPNGSIVVAGKSLQSPWKYAVPGFQTSVSYARLWTNFCEGPVPPEEGFLVTLSADGAQMLSHATIGATGGDLDSLSATGTAEMPLRVAVDAAGAVRVAGTTESGRTLPTRNPAVPDSALELYNSVNTRPFLLKALADGTLDYGTRFGARDGHAVATGVGADADGNVYVAGYGAGAGFPVVNAAGLQRRDTVSFAFVTRISEAPAALQFLATPPAALAGDATTLTARFGDTLYGAAVEFRDGARLLGGRALVAGQATLSVTLPVGMHALSAVIRGGGPWNGLTSSPAYVRIEQSSAAP
jgi:hypothetical protein